MIDERYRALDWMGAIEAAESAKILADRGELLEPICR
jgi:hypothetical protein